MLPALNQANPATLWLEKSLLVSYSLNSSKKQIILYNKEGYEVMDTGQFYNFFFHPAERSRLVSIEHTLLDFARNYTLKKKDHLNVSLIHQWRHESGYMKVLRFIYPILNSYVKECEGYYGFCLDITSHSIQNDITFQINPHLPELQHRLAQLLLPQPLPLTARQVEVLRAITKEETVEAAAQYLLIETRTLEKHLQNIRKKLNVKRTLDAALICKTAGIL